MKRRVDLALAVAACGGCSNVQISAGGASSGASVGVQGASSAGAVLAIGVLGAAVYGESYSGGIRYRANPFDAIGPSRAAPPPLDASRRVLEVDCSKPIEDWSANLKCR